MTNIGQIIFGYFTFANIVFEANYRFDGPTYNQGGFQKCLAISQGKDDNGYNVIGHSYFGDDKFRVEKAEFFVDKIILHLNYPLRSRCQYTNEKMQIVTLIRKN